VPEPDHYQANLQRGTLLLDRNQPRAALPFIQGAIAADPNVAHGYAELARCFNEIPGERHKTLDAINRAIALAPQISIYQGRKGWFLICQGRFQAALGPANEGLKLDPNCLSSLYALANAQTKLGYWEPAAETCRHILSIQPDDVPGLNLLAQALRLQGRIKESREVVDLMLAKMPNDAFGLSNAGFAALRVGDHVRAHEHFRDALRINPHFDLARRGLLASLRARSWLIRFHNRIHLRLPPRARAAICLVAMVAVPAILIPYATTEPKQSENQLQYWLGTLFAVILGYLYLVIIASLLGNFLLIFDSIYRHSLTRKEKVAACMPVILLLGTEAFLLIAQAWTEAGALLVLFGILVWSFQYPLFREHSKARNRER